MREALIWTINDFPTYEMLSGWSTQGRLYYVISFLKQIVIIEIDVTIYCCVFVG